MDDLYAGGDTGNSPEQGGEEQGGYCIKIYVGADNQVQSVAVEQEGGEHEQPEQDGQMGAAGEMEGGEDEGEEISAKIPVGSIDDAVKLVMKAYQAQGQLPAPGDDMGGGQGDQGGDAMADMMQGYGRGGLRGQSEGMGVRKVFR